MNTIETLKNHAALIMASGGPKNSDEIKVMEIFNTLTGKKAGNAGKRKIVKTGR